MSTDSNGGMRDWLQYLAALLLAASPLLWPAVAPWAVGLLALWLGVIYARILWSDVLRRWSRDAGF